MKELSREDRLKIYANLPVPLQDMLASDVLAEIITEIGRKFTLHIDQQELLSKVITYTLYGIIPQNKFADELQSTVKITGAQADEIVGEIDKKVFKVVHEKLRAAAEDPEIPEVDTKPPAVDTGLTPPDIGVVSTSLPGVSGKGTLGQLSEKSRMVKPPTADPYREPVDEPKK